MMSELDVRRRALALVDKHALAAQASPYDRHVAVAAIAKARTTVANAPIDPDDAAAAAGQIVAALTALHATYHDPDGEFTNGKGVLGNLIDDIVAAFSAAAPQ